MTDYAGDFESTTDPNNCYVWGWGISEVDNPENVTLGTSLDSFMEWCENHPINPKIWIHNLAWDSKFILSWLFDNGFEWVDSQNRASKTFTTIINNKGMFYSVEVIFYLKNKKVKKVTFWDSYKLIPIKIEKFPKTFNIPINKLQLDYSCHNGMPPGTPLKQNEADYISHDVKLQAYGLNFFYKHGLNKMTIGACALSEYKSLLGKNEFKLYFPTPKYHDDVRQSYKGGYSYLEPEFAGKTLKNGFVLDKNSMYPWVMKKKPLPYGNPIFFKGEYEPDKSYPLYIQMFRCAFELKPNKLPTVQIKKSLFFSGTEYLRDSRIDGQLCELTLCMTSVDFELFKDHYYYYNIEFFSGWKFRSKVGMFDAYIDKWSDAKIEARAEGNSGLEFISKLFLNNLYGKFGTSNKLCIKKPYIGNDGAVHFKNLPSEEKDGIYLPIATFVTSYAREDIVRTAQKIKDDYIAGKSNIQYVYSDTDSLHCICDKFEIPEGLEIDKYKLGAYKVEGIFKQAKFLRTKCYIERFAKNYEAEEPDYNLKVTVAGMPSDCADQVTFSNFKIGATYSGKKQPKAVKGGVILEDIDFTIKMT